MSRVLPLLSAALMLGASPVLAQSFPQTPDTGDAALASQPALTPDTQAPQLPPLAEGILVSVNNDMITSYDLKQRMLLLIVTSGVQVTQENYAAFQQQALNSLIDERLQQQELDHWKVKVTDAEVDDEIARMASQSNLKPDQLLSELKRVGVEPATLRAQIAAESGWNQLVGGRYHSSANVGTAQVDSLMDKVIADGQKPQYLVAEIFIDNTTAGSPANALQGAKQLRDQIAAKVAPFQAVARQFSNAPSAANGGDAGWLVSSNIEPSVETVLASLKPGEMSEPIVTKDGVYIYLLRQKTDGNADMVFRLKQAAVPLSANASPADVAAANAALASFRSRVDSCEAFDDLDGKAPAGIQVTDLGDAQLSTLLTNYADALRPLKNNQVTEPLRNAQNMNVLYVCDRQLAGDNALSRDQVENNLVNQRLSMLGRRYLRELRSTATIENH
ncbi:foldase protein PrsA [Asticcacaulis taihuensis]|uniref:foldase protein PrsA n=1 Tax=Asticcacaulis taihuensis TaxID=260084 RepID=UPI0026EF9BB1|nr:peptidylprolyl isomerase [Asticcacaulis taihuensis]